MADVASSFKNWSASAASNNPTSATVIGSGLAPNLQQIQATLRTELGTRSAPITAASTVDLNAVDEGTVLVEHISGTVSLSSFWTVQAGIKKLVTFSVTSGTLTLVYNATSMIIPSLANIVVADGDSLYAESLGSGNWKVHWYSRADGTPVGINILNADNDPTFSSISDNESVSPEWVRGVSKFTREYTSPQQTITAASMLTIAHGMGVLVKEIEVSLVCQTAEGNWSINDVVHVGWFALGTGTAATAQGFVWYSDATNLYILFGNSAGSSNFQIPNKTTFNLVNITNSNWKIIFKCWS